MKREKKYLYIYIGFFLLIFLIVVSYFLLGKKSKVKKIKPFVSPTSILIPTIDRSVKVELKSASSKKEVVLTIENILPGTEMIDYELSYQTAKQGLQGIIGTVKLGGEKILQKKLILGTCSSGACVYHEVVGSIKLILRFNGIYGEKIFEKEYSI